MALFSPPPFITPFDYKSCRQINDPVTRKRVYETPDGEQLPSVTTVLGATKDMTHLREWRQRVGEEKAAQITREAAGVGTSMHSSLEKFLAGLPREPGSNLVHQQANAMANTIIQHGLKDIDEVWAIEQSLYYPGLYSGTTDLIAVYKGNPSICDYKQANKVKKREWIEDYFLQLVAYMMAHNQVYGTNIREGHIFMCTRDLTYQQFDLWPNEYSQYEEQWLSKLEQYYKL
jgi:genome maintenance exonuclease 1